MTVAEIKQIVLDAAEAKEKNDAAEAELIQQEIEKLLKAVQDVMGKPIDNLQDRKLVPKGIENAANILRECHSI